MMNTAQNRESARLTLDPLQARKFLEVLYGRFFAQANAKAFLEVRGKREGEQEGLSFRRFYLGIDELVEDMARWEPDLNYWVGVALRRNTQSGKKDNLLALTASFGDVDCGAEGHKKAPKYQTKAEALAALESFPLRPTLLIDSGGGFQPYWLFQEPMKLIDGNLAKAERLNRGLAAALGGDMGATDAARILRVPGTYNMKLARDPRPVEIVWCEPGRVYDVAELAKYEAHEAPRGEARPQPGGDYEAYAQKALGDEIAKLAGANEGERNTQLNQAAFSLGQLAGAGVLDRGIVEAGLHGVAMSIGLIETEARATIKSGLEAGMREPRELPERERPKGKDAQKSQKKAQAALMPPALKTITAKELAAKEFSPRRWAIPDLITDGLTILAGKPKAGKSWLALNIGVAVATAGMALGKIQVEQGGVLYLALEDSERRLKERLEKIVGPGEPFSEGLHIVTATGFPPLYSGGLAALDEWLAEHPGVKLVVIDTLGRVKPARGRNQDSYAHDTIVMSALQKISIDHQLALILVHHTKKAGADDFVDEVSGTFGLTGAADCVAVLARQARGKMDGILKLTGRDIEEKELALKFDPNWGRWELLGEASEFNKSPERQDIWLLLKETGPRTPAQVAKLLNKEPATIRKLLWSMKKAGEVKSISGNKYIVC